MNLEEDEEEEVCLLQDSITLSNRYIVTTETLQCSPFLFYPPPSLSKILSLSLTHCLSLHLVLLRRCFGTFSWIKSQPQCSLYRANFFSI